MTLTIQTSEDTQRQMTLTIEVDEGRVKKAMQKKARELSRDVRVPGFRPGKAPFDVIVRHIGEETLRAETIEDLIQPVFEEALDQTQLDPYAQPSLDDIESQPLKFTFTVPLTPEVKLGDYRALRKDIEAVEVTDEALEEALEQVRIRHQTLEVVERPAETGDVVTISGRGQFTSPKPAAADTKPPTEEVADSSTEPVDESPDDQMIFDEERLEILLESKTLFPDTPFVDNVVGMSVGDEKTFGFTFPDPYEHESEYTGREATFTLSILEVKKRELPPLDDELAKLEGTHETLEELRNDMRDNLTRQAERNAKDKLVEEMVDHLLEDAEVVYPPAAVELQIDEMLADFKNILTRSGWEFKDYLSLQGLTEQSIRDDFRENAEKQVTRNFVLRELILSEKLRVEMSDIDAIVEERVARFDNEGLRDSMRNYYRNGQGFEQISSEVLSNKLYERIRDIFGGNAPDLNALAEANETTTEEEE